MDVYLMQHGVAADEAADPARPLTPAGRAEVELVARRAGVLGVRAGRCLHSGKLRAEQTARILAAALGADVEQVPGLNPSDPLGPLLDRLATLDRAGSVSAIAIVGHLPYLDRLASQLVAGREDARAVRFQNAGLVKLVPKVGGPGYSVSWVLTPELAG